MPAFSLHDTELFERMAEELRRAAAELRQLAASTPHKAPDAPEKLEAYAAAIVRDLKQA